MGTRLRVLEICGGAGGQALGLEQAGFEHLAIAEIDPDACNTLRANRPAWKVIEGDIRDLDGRQFRGPLGTGIDLLAGGVPCFIAGTMILTASGYVPIESISVGDLVLTHKGAWRRVTSTMTRDNAQLWRVQAGQTIITTPEHPFFARVQRNRWSVTKQRSIRELGDPGWVEASRLTTKHRIGHVLPPVEWPSETRESWWWLAGRYLADGWPSARNKTGAGNPVTSDQGRVVIACGPGKDEELRKTLSAAGLCASEVCDGNVVKFHVHGQEFYRWCQHFGHGAAGKNLPVEALALPGYLAESLLDGYLAGDGHLGKGGWEVRTISKALALGLVMLTHRVLGVVASIQEVNPPVTHIIEGRTVQQQPSWRVTIPSANRSHLVIMDYAWRLVKRSEPMHETGTVYNISVDEDESYIADGVIVHNCQPFSVGGKQLGAGDDRDLFQEAMRLVHETRPRAVMLENVPGLAQARFRSYRQEIIAELGHLGYAVQWKTIRSCDYGVPQLRPRFVLVALKMRYCDRFTWPAGAAGMNSSVSTTLYDLMAARGWEGAYDWAIRANSIAPTIVGGSKKHGGPDLGPTRARAAWRMLGVNGSSIAEEAPGPDVPADHVPRLTIRMVARLQGFPDDWAFAGRKTAAYRQVGNSFPPPVARAFGEAIRAALST
jgi:DNA (cytosine-5)-methyltransferase 1